MLGRFIALNLISRLWSALSSLLFVPLYVSLLGTDSFAIIALGATVAGVIAIFDLGMSNAVLREMARADVSQLERHGAFVTLRTFYLSALALLLLTAPLAAVQVERALISNSPLGAGLLQFCLVLVIAEAACQLFLRFLVNTLMGADRQVAGNLFNLGWSIARNALVALPLLFCAKLEVFLTWQLASTLLFTIAALWYVQKRMFGGAERFHGLFDRSAFVRMRRFAGGVFLISLVAAVNTQLDKLVIGRTLDIINLGYYSLAVTLGTGLLVLPSAVAASIQPRLTAHFSTAQPNAAGTLYMQVSTLAAIGVGAVAAVIAVNPGAVLLTWTGDAALAKSVAPVLPTVILAYALLAFAALPFSVALANGHTRFNNIIGLVNLLMAIPGYWFAVSRYGMVGAASVFLGIQALATLSYLVLIDRSFVHFGVWRTLARLLLMPALLNASVAAWLAASFGDQAHSRLELFCYLALCCAAAAVFSLAVMRLLFGLRLKLD
jgi:O-antigen/teichoic acid export membrane protein